jgi:hypothetical protein
MKKRSWRIQTSGPGFRFEGTLTAAKGEVERCAPLKRGWSAKWMRRGNAWFYLRYNSKGAALPRFTVMVRPISG